MSPGAYAFVRSSFDMGKGTTVVQRLRVELLYNGSPIGEHATEEDANATADEMSKRLGTIRECFTTRSVWK